MEWASLIIGVIIGFVAGLVYSKNRSGTGNSGGKKVVYSQRQEKEENKEKILGLLREKGKVTNNDVENSLGVSDATATRYLSELESEGKVSQIGATGKSVYYTLK